MGEKKEQPKDISTLKFEEASAELEQIVSRLEDGQLSLEDTLFLYGRGQELAKHCGGLLNQAELKVRTLAGKNPLIDQVIEDL
jgi:exodeoxyribonuclease VII small subunit